MTPAVVRLIEAKLKRQEWSPQQISSWLAQTQQTCISHACIYQHIWADRRAGGTLFQQLRRTGKRYNKRGGKLAGRGIIPGPIDIDQRPAIVNQRARIGEWEVTPSSAPASKAPFSAWCVDFLAESTRFFH